MKGVIQSITKAEMSNSKHGGQTRKGVMMTRKGSILRTWTSVLDGEVAHEL